MNAPDDNDYSVIARAYADKVEGNAWNAYYERPAVLRLVGDVAGQRVLDAGCGSGLHAEALVDRGAAVIGIDASAGLLSLATERLGGRARFEHADISEPLPFKDASFECVLAALVMHYLRDWKPTLAEFHRVLVPDGRLVISTHHPFMDHTLADGEDYFATYQLNEEWELGGRVASMRFWHRPLSEMTGALNDAGFALDRIEEPAPDPAVRDVDPEASQSLTTEPRFIFFLARSESERHDVSRSSIA